MKKYIIGLLMISLILSGCSKEKVFRRYEEKQQEIQAELNVEQEIEEQVEIVEVSSDADELSEENFIKIVKKINIFFDFKVDI